MPNSNSPRAGSARAVNCLLGGDDHGHTIGMLRVEVLASRFHVPTHRAQLIAGLAWGSATHG
jgi:hypothetical protein